ncbi:hypothetical protein [Pseudomonas sp. NPDC096950]|uniref:hypothetical protein n=1 Tax=Pseudomonas sp. NPDC096950 TaxID=3364485 RepID=UPI00383BEFF6
MKRLLQHAVTPLNWWVTLWFRFQMWMCHHAVEIMRPGEGKRIKAKYFALRDRVNAAETINHGNNEQVTRLHEEMKALLDRYFELTGRALDPLHQPLK